MNQVFEIGVLFSRGLDHSDVSSRPNLPTTWPSFDTSSRKLAHHPDKTKSWQSNSGLVQLSLKLLEYG